ncbi:hypothetical protein [Roseiterribacter gracilis]|uniref:Uncharacterized protein n=1 Tax=Roseiterribacter gracilis TaxID=2812848 RepID=A0A8S8X7U1_9PROT|nr:hypothetical protein TMPK1_16500 [Rhodospirillales bacterium TMPK1]
MPARFLVAAILLLAPVASHATSLDVVVADGANQVPGLRGDDLPRAILNSMQHVAPRDMSVEVAPKGPLPPNRVEWRFHANPYAGGAVKYIGPARSAAERLFGVHRQVTAEAKLFLDGKYQSTVFGEANLAGTADEPSFTALIEGLTTTLLHTPHG